uniref:Uncharacterized protein n=1 Tax=Anguilla anguilla TaxID=7936 RepID=A0A0E9W7Z8_ANGAN
MFRGKEREKEPTNKQTGKPIRFMFMCVDWLCTCLFLQCILNITVMQFCVFQTLT